MKFLRAGQFRTFFPSKQVSSGRSRKALSAVLALGVASVLAAPMSPLAQADTQPPAGVPATVSSDALPTVQVNGVVWTQLIVGGTVFAAGEFTAARPAGAAPGKSTVARKNLLAYDIATGKLLSFAPNLNGQVLGLAASPDKRTLYVSGQFTTVNGQPRSRIAAFNIASQALSTTFKPSADAQVYGLAATASRVYVVGSFTRINGVAKKQVAAVSATNGSVVTSFSPVPNGPAGTSVRNVLVSPTGSGVILGGSFTTMNGSSNPGYGLARVHQDTGKNLPLTANSTVRSAGSRASIMSLSAASDGFYGSAYAFSTETGNLEGAFKADWNGNLIWLEDCHGDTYSIAAGSKGAVYVAGHPHECVGLGAFPDSNPVTHHRGLAFTTARTGTITGFKSGYFDFRGKPAPSLLNWYPDINTGTYTGQSQGPWSVAVNGDYVVYGGEFTTVNGKPQQGLVRFARRELAPNDDGPRSSGSGFALTGSSPAGSARVNLSWRASWDRDNVKLTYRVYRGTTLVATIGRTSTFWNRPTMTYADTGRARGASYSYKVVASDFYGNQQTSSTITVRAN